MNTVLFITYSSHDEFQVQQIANELRKQIPVFAYPFDIPGGPQIHDGIKERPEKNIILAIAISQSSVKQEWLRTAITNVLLKPLEGLIKVFLLKLDEIPARGLSGLPYVHKYETVDLSGEYYRNGMSALIARTGLPTPTVTPPRPRVPYEIGGVFQAARPATELFADLKRQIELGSIDQKYLYWDVRAALRWQRIAELSSYMTSQISTNLLVVNAQGIIDTICADTDCDDVSFVNLGVGTGVKDYHIITRLLDHGKKVVYIAVDESFPMIQITMKTLEELLSSHVHELGAHYIVDDFTNMERHDGYMSSIEVESAPRIIGLLGGSLGNFNESRILSIIRKLMRHKDYLMLGVEYIGGRDDEALILNYSDIRMKEFLFGPIMDITGREPDWRYDFDYSVYPNPGVPSHSVVENARGVIGKVRYNQKKVELFCSTKYEKPSLDAFLQAEAGFNILSVFTSPEPNPRYGKYILKLA